MTVLPKTIQIFLPDGNARSIRIAEITSRTVQAVLVPRSKLQDAGKRDEVQRVGVYFLFGDSETDAKPLAYVGEAEDCYARLKQHNVAKDFWTHAVVIVSKTQAFTKAHAKYLEWYCHEQAANAKRFKLENGNVPSKPFLPEPAIADLIDNFETIRVLVGTLGYPLFDEAAQQAAEREIFVCKGPGAAGQGEYVEDGFVVLEGSKAAPRLTPSAKGTWVEKIRDVLIKDGVLVLAGESYRFAENHVFTSPSAAAVAVLGRNANGWTEWKDKQGHTLDQLKRQTDAPPTK